LSNKEIVMVVDANIVIRHNFFGQKSFHFLFETTI